MRKPFTEPEIRKIELNLKENIAYSYKDTDNQYVMYGLDATIGENCIAIKSGIHAKDLISGNYSYEQHMLLFACKNTAGGTAVQTVEVAVPAGYY